MIKILKSPLKLSLIIILNFTMFNSLKANELKIYSERQPLLIEPLLKEFEKDTGIKVEWIYSKKGLVQKIILEKSNPVADIFLSSDISRLIDISEAGASVKIQPLSTVPTNLQSDYWAGLTQRARIIYVNKDLNIKNINYEDLANEDYKGKICVRSGFHPYNISLFASLMAHHSEEWLETYLTDLKANLARKPQGNDRDQVKAIYAGVCDYSIGNHYYFFKMQDNDDQKVWLDKATVVFPNQENRGTHVNISGIAILNQNKLELAEKLVQFLAGKKAQSIYANDNNEFPVSPEVSVSEKVKKLAGNAKFDSLDLEKLASNRKAVINLLNKINFDE
ncbi:extracellular solute-binding protein [Alphaproteobacteria bacterium]|nr:extracellular solute-binding protein [Alphaproteobacteria bacterium]